MSSERQCEKELGKVEEEGAQENGENPCSRFASHFDLSISQDTQHSPPCGERMQSNVLLENLLTINITMKMDVCIIIRFSCILYHLRAFHESRTFTASMRSPRGRTRAQLRWHSIRSRVNVHSDRPFDIYFPLAACNWQSFASGAQSHASFCNKNETK